MSINLQEANTLKIANSGSSETASLKAALDGKAKELEAALAEKRTLGFELTKMEAKVCLLVLLNLNKHLKVLM